MLAYDDPPDHDLGPSDCRRCECHESRHTEPGGGCAACDCDGFRGKHSLGFAEPEPEHEVVDGPCEYERIGDRQ